MKKNLMVNLIYESKKVFVWFSKKTMGSLCRKTGSMYGFQAVKDKNRTWFMQKNRIVRGFMHENRPGFVQKNWLGSRFLCINRVDAGFSCTNHTGFMQKNRTWFSCIVHTRTMYQSPNQTTLDLFCFDHMSH